MRVPSLTALLAVSAVAAGAPVPAPAAAPEGEKQPVRIRVNLQSVDFTKEIWSGVRSEAVEKLLRDGLVDGEAGQQLRPYSAAAIQAGKAAVVDSLIVTTPEGVPARIQSASRDRRPSVSLSVLPSLVDGQISAEISVIFGSRTGSVYTGQAVVETVRVPDDGTVALRFNGPKEGPAHRVMFLRFTRLEP